MLSIASTVGGTVQAFPVGVNANVQSLWKETSQLSFTAGWPDRIHFKGKERQDDCIRGAGTNQFCALKTQYSH